jgi:AAA domain
VSAFYGHDYDDDGRPLPDIGPQIVNLCDVEPEHVEWLWDDHLPLGKLVVLDGDPGVGKSTVSLDLAARVSTGSPMPDGSAGAKGAVLILSAEDGLADTIRPRIDAAGGDPARVHALTVITYPGEDGKVLSRTPAIPRDIPAIEAIITVHRVILVIIDVLVAYLGGDVNSHHDQDVRRALSPVAAMADRTGCCVLVLRHLNKTAGASAVYRGGGSIGIIGAARAGFMCGTDPDNETRRVLAPVRCNLSAEPPAIAYQLIPDELHGCARVRWLGETTLKPWQLLSDPGDSESRSERDEAAEWLRGYLIDNGGEAKAGDAIKAARGDGIAQRTLQTARKRAGVTTAKVGVRGPWLWRLDVPDSAPKMPKGAEGAPSTQQAPSASSEAPSGDPSLICEAPARSRPNAHRVVGPG